LGRGHWTYLESDKYFSSTCLTLLESLVYETRRCTVYSISTWPRLFRPILRQFSFLSIVLLNSKEWRLQREERQSHRRRSIEMKSDWLFDKPRSNCWLRVPARNLASQSPCLTEVTQNYCNPQWGFLRFLGCLLGPEEGMGRILGQTCNFSCEEEPTQIF